MKYTERDIEKAIQLKLEGYNWIAKNKAGRPFAFGRIPYRYAADSNEYNIWENQLGTPWLMLSKDEFTSITWENEPVYIDEIITEGKVQANGDTAIERLTAENDELKARVENAVELPCVKMVKTKEWIDGVEVGDDIWEWAVVYIDRQGEFVVEPCKSKIAAEARLEEIKGGNKQMTGREWLNSLPDEEFINYLVKQKDGICISDTNKEYTMRCIKMNDNCRKCILEFLKSNYSGNPNS